MGIGKIVKRFITEETATRATTRAVVGTAGRVAAGELGEEVRENLPQDPESFSEDTESPGIDTDFANWKYPLDVSDSEEQPHSVIFHINVRERSSAGQVAKSKVDAGFTNWQAAQETKKETVSAENTAENRASGEQLDFLKIAFQAAFGYGGFKLGKSLVNSVAPGASSIVKNGIAIATGATTFKMSEGIAGQVIQANETIRLLNSIQLYVPTAPNASYGAKWNNTSVGAVGGGILSGAIGLPEDMSSIGDTIANVVSGNSPTANAVARSVIQGAANLPSQLGGTQLGDVFDIATKTTLNPFREQLFEQMDFRSFGFTYTFAPRNETELDAVMNIIQLFKYHMHPELTEGSTVMIYPSEFNIEYMYKSGRNQYVNKISSCALTNLDVSYGGADFTTFKGTAGAPSQITMRLKFTELEMLVRQKTENDTTKGGITQDWRNSK